MMPHDFNDIIKLPFLYIVLRERILVAEITYGPSLFAPETNLTGLSLKISNVLVSDTGSGLSEK